MKASLVITSPKPENSGDYTAVAVISYDNITLSASANVTLYVVGKQMC